MKSKIFISLIVIALLSACSESILDIENENSYTTNTFFVDSKSVTEASTAAYAVMLMPGMHVREWFFIFDLFGNDCEKNFPLQGSLLAFPNYTHDGNTLELNYLFMSLYRMILRANVALDAIETWAPAASGDVSLAQRLTGEMEFLKAYAYFTLVTCYGDVPLKKTLADHLILEAERTPKAEVWAYIESQLTDAIAKLPVSYATADYGRATKGAAVALLGKSYLYQEKYTEALTQFTLLQSAPYDYNLATSLDDIFLKDMKTKETVFAVMHGVWQGSGVGHSRYMLGRRSETTAGGKVTHSGRAMEYGFNDFWNCLVSDALADSYTYEDEGGNAYVDPRAKLTFYDNLGTAGGDPIYCELASVGPKSYAAKVGTAKRILSWRKYQMYEEREKYGNPDSWLNNQIIRYADVLLMMAECYIETNQVDLALPLINRVRARSGAFQYTTLGNQAEATEILRHERQMELAGEQVRWNDLVRWGILQETINAEKFAYNGTQPVKPYHVLFPIPQPERDANPTLNAQVNNNWN